MTVNASVIGEADLHGLVDGHLEADRRADILQRLTGSPTDQALVEAWQEQNNLIRAAFRDVESEALPIALDAATPRLRCIDGDLGRQLDASAAPLRLPTCEAATASSRSAIATAAALLVVAIGLAAFWVMFERSHGDRIATEAVAEATLAERSVAALDEKTVSGDSSLRPIPDLSAAGLRLANASTQAGGPLVLRYRDAGIGRVVLSVAGAPDEGATPPTSMGEALTWRRGGTVYALAGNLPPDRLRALAQSLQEDADRE